MRTISPLGKLWVSVETCHGRNPKMKIFLHFALGRHCLALEEIPLRQLNSKLQGLSQAFRLFLRWT